MMTERWSVDSDGDDSGTTPASAAEPVHATAEVLQAAAVDSALHNSNTTSAPSYQYDSSGMTELSLVTDEVSYSVIILLIIVIYSSKRR